MKDKQRITKFLKRKGIVFEPTEQDLAISGTLASLQDFWGIIEELKKYKIKSMVDIGCGYGAVTKIMVEYLGVDAWGIDKDENRLKVSNGRIKTHCLDIEKQKLPFKDNSIELVTSFGMIEHLVYYDSLFMEAKRILKKDSILLISIPNLGSWLNRINLLFGFQPRDVEISSGPSFGINSFHYTSTSRGHIHSATLRAFKGILKYYKFEIIRIKSHRPYQFNLIIKFFDTLFFPLSFQRRLMFLCKKK